MRSLPDGEVRVRALENHWLQIGSGRSTFKLAAMAKDNFPALPAVPPALAEVRAGTLGGLIDRTAFAMSNEESNYTLNGALLVLRPGKIEMVATDGSRLSLAGPEVEVAGLKNEERMLLPGRALAALRRLADAQESDTPIKIARDDSHLFFSAGDSIVITRLISGQFPNYQLLLPESADHELRVEREELADVVRRVSLLAQRNAPLRLAFSEGQLMVSAYTPDVGEAREALPLPFSGEPFEIGFNAEFLRDGLESVDSPDVVIKLTGPLRPGLIESADGGEFVYLVMPIRLNT